MILCHTKNKYAGDTITDDKLNHMEDGIADSGGGGAFLINISDDGGLYTLSKTWKEIKDALTSGKQCIAIYEDLEDAYPFSRYYSLSYMDYSGGAEPSDANYNVAFQGNQSYSCTDENDYPFASAD